VDLQLYLNVLWRFRVLVIFGLLIASSLAFLSFVKVSFTAGVPDIEYRKAPQWRSDTTLFITQEGFSYGSVAEPYVPADEKTGIPAIPLADPDRLALLTALYAQLANGDSVRAVMRREGPVNGTLRFEPIFSPDGASTLPLLTIEAFATSPSGAVQLSSRAAEAFRTWLVGQQNRAGIFREQRVIVEVLNRASVPTQVVGPGKTVPVVVFLTVMSLVLGLVFILENLRPRVRTVTDRRLQAARSA
jgi:hypothetical protein